MYAVTSWAASEAALIAVTNVLPAVSEMLIASRGRAAVPVMIRKSPGFTAAGNASERFGRLDSLPAAACWMSRIGDATDAATACADGELTFPAASLAVAA